MATIYLVACTKSKRPLPAEARDLYVSPRFAYARTIAEREGDRWYVLSAAHGILSPRKVIDPYERTLRDMSRDERRRWSAQVAADLRSATGPDDAIVFLASALYRDEVIAQLRQCGYSRLCSPLKGLRQGEQLAWLKQHAGDVSSSPCDAQGSLPAGEAEAGEALGHLLEQFYSLLDELSLGLDGGRILGECTGRMSWPRRGLYFMHAPGEMRGDGCKSRVVRVGTHALKDGSSSTLWRRLHQHRGTAEGGGSHRASVLRLHVGRALARRYPEKDPPPTWGVGSSASRPITAQEAAWEQLVSRYLASTRVIWLSIDDAPGPDSDRGFIERNAIALLSTAGCAKNAPGRSWLGHDAQAEAIRLSGLWNVNHVAGEVDAQFLNRLAEYVRLTIEDHPAS